MPVLTSSGVFCVSDLKILPLSTDVVGSAPTYGTAVDIPGIKNLKMSKNISEKESKGDEKVLDTETTFQYVDVSWENAEVSLDALKAIEGTAAVVQTTGTPNTASIIESGDDKSAYFQIQCKAKRGSNVAAVGVQLYKVRGTLSYDFVGEDYAVCSFKGKAIPCKGTIETVVAPYRKLTFGDGAITFS